MKFQIAALAFAAAGAMAHGHKNDTMMTSTVWQTVERTVLSCAPTVTNCPAESRSAVVVTDTVALYTTICPVTAAEAHSTAAPAPPAPAKSSAAPAPPAPVTTAAPVATNTPMAPGSGMTYATEPSPTAGAASNTLGTVTAPAATGSSAPIQTGAAVRAGPAMGGLAVAAAVAMML